MSVRPGKRYCPRERRRKSFWAVVGMPARGKELHEGLHGGFSYEVYNNLAALSGLGKKGLAEVTVIAPATLQRRAKAGKFNRDESDRLYRFAKILKAATDLFEGDVETAKTWLKTPVRGLGNRKPVDMLATSAETEAVMELIGRLEHGVFT